MNSRHNRMEEHDACALIAHVHPLPTRRGVERVLEGLRCMEHRTGIVGHEGDGVGIHLDLPRALWRSRVGEKASQPDFFVAHLFLPVQNAETLLERITTLMRSEGVEILHSEWHPVDSRALGPIARRNEPVFVQLAGVLPVAEEVFEARLFEIHMGIERETPAHVVSMSRHHVVYKVHGNADTLFHYYPDLHREDLVSAITLGHSRYSTNTLPAFERVQPFTLLGHNGEINTIDRLRREAAMLGVQLTRDGSDSQDLDRFLHTLIARHDLTLFQAMELVFPPILDEIVRYSDPMKSLYQRLRHCWGPYAQGPAALITRWKDTCCFGTDALGLRPLWIVPTEEGSYFTSERGSIPFEIITDEPRPFAPGEKIGVILKRGEGITLLDYDTLQEQVRQSFETFKKEEMGEWESKRGEEWKNGSVEGWKDGSIEDPPPHHLTTPPSHHFPTLPREKRFGLHCFCTEDFDYLEFLAESGNEPVGSLGYDGPLAALAPERQTLSDYCKESVAVVTNPAMDHEREMEHFNTSWVYGRRPNLLPHNLGEQPQESVGGGQAGRMEASHLHTSIPPYLQTTRPPHLTTSLPIFPDLAACSQWLGEEAIRACAEGAGTLVLEDLLACFSTRRLLLTQRLDQSLEDRLQELAQEAVEAVRQGIVLLLLDDSESFSEGYIPIDPHLALASVDHAMRSRWYKENEKRKDDTALRRHCNLILRSGTLRNLHDLIFAFGLGADGICPYLLLEAGVLYDINRNEITGEQRAQRLSNILSGLAKGLEKVISTMGTHELRGYGRNFASIGIAPSLAELLGIRNFYGSEAVGLTLQRLEQEARKRYELAHSETPLRERRDSRFYPKVWKIAGQVAAGLQPYEAFSQRVQEVEREHPVSLRHLLDFRFTESPLSPEEVDTGVDIHTYPIQISAMSFGSQGETAYRAYVEAAKRLNIVCVNGEGGEIQDLFGRYTANRGQQVASGRFGVCPEMLNSAYVIEIKIGQGAKPGEGGHLPGKKVSLKVAQARNATPGIDLISPSNNHDIYSIEDLAQLVEELKTSNPHARVSVKVPVVPNIGTIAVGIAKAGADIITLSGYDGGTGAARTHALKCVGLPVEIGVKESHTALVRAGIRHQVELWCDGGIKTGRDVVKLILLGANRCGFGTMAMVAAGCTICRACQTDTCHVGIATQIENEEEAQAKGLKRFVPRDFETAVEQLCILFQSIGEEIRQLTAQLGFRCTQDMVGRSDLLYQAFGHEMIDLKELLEPVPEKQALYAVTRPPIALSRALSDQVAQYAAEGAQRIAIQVSSSRFQVSGCSITNDQSLTTHPLTPSPPHPLTPCANSRERALGTHLAGSVVRWSLYGERGGEWENRRIEEREGMEGWNGGRVEGQKSEAPPPEAPKPEAPKPGKGNGRRLAWNDPEPVPIERAELDLHDTVVGNGFGAFNTWKLNLRVQGGAQDGVGKCSLGGRIVVLKGHNREGKRLDGSVGKGFAYGAQRGLFIIQGYADSRFCIRLSGAQVVAGARLSHPIDDSKGLLANRAHLKGFAFEYMTSGTAVVLGDPGVWMCAGMTGGVVYVKLWHEYGFDIPALKRRLGKGAKVGITPLNDYDVQRIRELLEEYRQELVRAGQEDEAAIIAQISEKAEQEFVAVRPVNLQMDQTVSTE